MDRTEVFDIILETIKHMQTSDFDESGGGWVNIAQLGTLLKKNNVDFTLLGYRRLKEFIKSFTPQLEVENFIPDGKRASVSYVRIADDITAGVITDNTFSNNGKKNTPNKNNAQVKNTTCALFEWAYLKDFDKLLLKLSELALDEKWDFKITIGTRPLSILRNFFIYTFERLQYENKIFISSSKKFAVFNTGLVNKLYSPIFALFTKNSIPGKQPWYFTDFAIEGEDRAGKTLVTEFRELPQSAEYFTNITDVYYDVKMGRPILDTTHILVERAERLPIQFLQSFGPSSFKFKDFSNLSDDEKVQYALELKNSLKTDIDALRRMQNRLDSAVNLAIKRVRWNYKSAIPMYYPRAQKMHLLLPLCLVDDQIVDTALVVSKENSGRYQGQTIYLLDWAYKCARLVCRPDSDWLTVESITTSQEDLE